MAVSIQDRTQEFRSCVAALSKINSTSASASRNQLLLSPSSPPMPSQSGANGVIHGPGEGATKGQRTEFARRAVAISKDINMAMGKLQRLGQLAKRKTLFDDRPVEIAELTFVIKQDLAKINQSISELQSFVKSGKKHWARKGESQVDEHSENVVVLLQGKLTDVTAGFREVLEVRTKNIQASKSRTEQFISSASASAKDTSGFKTKSPLYAHSSSQQQSSLENPYGISHGDPENPYGAQNAEAGEYLTLPDQQQSLMLLEEQQDMYISERNTAIEAIESTIHELGGIFAQLATMVAEQREVVQRIDADTEDIAVNISSAQRELLQYFARMSSNRWLMVRVFGILIIFFLLWVLVSP
ncbi:t-SNARE [Lipomyces kononenkoae]|uniref:t-SNARE n=1 Tax=Lipomyces kononenkoae TaxID=34357 RepID=A0ACC3SXJ0_LIPKO